MKTNPLYIDIHILQTVPPSNINRDDTGSPKTAQFGGVTRSRVSSQAWKKATRDLFPEMLNTVDLGLRTKHSVELIAEEMVKKSENTALADARKKAKAVLGLLKQGKEGIKFDKEDKEGRVKTKSLIFISKPQIEQLAELALEKTPQKDAGEKAKSIMDPSINPQYVAPDIALFGRMVAGSPNINVDAAVQVAHAIGVSKVETEYDYFTALDDLNYDDSSGAAMLDTTEFNSSLLYRYATVDAYHLFENLGSAEAAVKTAEAFIKAFVTSMPAGKQNSFANRTLPSVVVVQIRDTQPVSLVNAFEAPVRASAEVGQTELACKALVAQEKLIDEAFGTAPKKVFVVRAAQNTDALDSLESACVCSLSKLIEGVSETLAAYLGQCGSDEEGI